MIKSKIDFIEDMILRLAYRVNKGIGNCLFRLIKTYYHSEENKIRRELIKKSIEIEQIQRSLTLELSSLKEQSDLYKNSLNKVCQSCGKKMPY